MSEVDYEAIEQAVTETVRGRWFLNEFARRNRLTETRQLLDAMARVETVLAAGQTALPSGDPSIRLLIQRIKEIAGHLDDIGREMRDDGIEERHWRAVDHQARAVAGLMRSATPSKPALAREEATPAVRLPRADLPASLAPASRPVPAAAADPRVAALSGLDGLTLAEKLALFS